MAGAPQQMRGDEHGNRPVLAPLFQTRPECRGRLARWAGGIVQRVLDERGALDPGPDQGVVVGPSAAAFDQAFAIPHGEAGEFAHRVHQGQPVARRHRPRAEIPEVAVERHVDQSRRRRADGRKPVGDGEGENRLEGLPGKLERAGVRLALRQERAGLLVLEDKRGCDASPGLGREYGKDQAVPALRDGDEAMAGAVLGQQGEHPRRAAGGALQRGERAVLAWRRGAAALRGDGRVCRAARLPFEEAAQHARAGRVRQLVQCLGLDLADALARHRVLPADLLQGMVALRANAEAHAQYSLLPRRQGAEQLLHGVAQVGPDRGIEGLHRVLVLDQVA